MPQVTTNTQIDTINILNEANAANSTDLFILQRGSVSLKLKKQNFIIPRQQIAPIDSMKVLGNLGNSSAEPNEITVLDSNDSDSNLDTALVTEKRIKDYIGTEISNSEASTSPFGSNYLNDMVYQNTSGRKILVTAIIDSGNDIPGFAAHSGPIEIDVNNGGSGRDQHGRDKYTCKAFEFHISDGSNPDATTLIFVVEPNHYFKIFGTNASIIKSMSYEL